MDRTPTAAEFTKFQSQYLIVYLFAMASDWLQGPYVYALYSFYGFDKGDIGILFIAGFGSSAIMGTVAGSMADRYGRKLNCIIYGVTYALSCVTKHYNNYWILMVGRLLGGISTSILFSAFESWMVYEHKKRGFSESTVNHTFALQTTVNGATAVVCGILAQWGVDAFGHPVAPFDMALFCLGVCTLFVIFTWSENYGSTDSDSNALSGLSEGWSMIRSDSKIMLLGMIQSLFEGAMYTFVFMWTPTLEQTGAKVPHGFVMAAFMTSAAIGGRVFKYCSDTNGKVEHFMSKAFLVAAICNTVPILNTDPKVNMVAFCVFEVVVGMFWSGLGVMRSRYVPESARASIMNIFRIPLNLFVCLILLKVGSLSIGGVFVFCAAAHACVWLMQSHLAKITDKIPESDSV